ncbi:hypothetical protein TNCV_4363671 [Trichonephila clavipes]|nr:hypothetical protein TNCV_4363671 [Trichonephila clavipes]
MFDNTADVHLLFFPLTLKESAFLSRFSFSSQTIRARLDSPLPFPKMTLLDSRGGSTTRLSSSLIDRPTKACTRPSVISVLLSRT